MMTRTNFKAIAEILKHQRLSISAPSEDHERSFHSLCEKLATYFKQDNPTFNRSKFMRACGWYDE